MNTTTVLHDGGRVRAVQTGSRLKVEARHDDRVTVTATRTETIHVSTPGPQGSQGEPGRDGVDGVGVAGPPGPLGGYQFFQDTPAATWSFTHQVGRMPVAITYDGNGRRIFPDTLSTTTQVVLTFAFPMRGSVILL